MSDQIINPIETEAQERLSALLKQEIRYECPDYLSPDYTSREVPQAPSPLLIVEECAKLVTDFNFVRPKSPSSSMFLASTKNMAPAAQQLDQSQLMATWRRQMCKWAYTAVDTFEFDRELVAVAFSVLDRYLAHEIQSEDDRIGREDFQLYCMTSFYTVVKIMEPKRKLGISALIDMSRGYYSEEDVAETELDILEAIDWRVNPPTPLAFCRLLLSTYSTDISNKLIKECEKYTELAVKDDYFLSIKPSTVAVAAVLAAARQHDVSTEDFLKNLEGFMEVDMDAVQAACEHF